MDLRYEAFCFADRYFFDVQGNPDNVREDEFSSQIEPLPDGWGTETRDVWLVARPVGGELAGQGWKAHVSATPSNAVEVLRITRDYCVEHAVAFKYLRTSSILLARNSKYAARQASGKFITIYPDADDLHKVLVELTERLRGVEGPYILSDLRYGPGPVYVRYGAFLEQWTNDGDGNRVPAIRRPDGVLVPDERRPTFNVPDWVTLPTFLAPHLAARRAPAAFPYRVLSSLHFSNAGGVYLAEPEGGGKPLILKEARPHAGLDRDGTDAVRRLTREHDVLCRLAGVPGVPEVIGRLIVGEHHFLAMSHLPGVPLGRWLALHYPLSRHDVDADVIAEYTQRALRVLDRIEELIQRLHDRGVVFGDLHDRNILIDDDDRISLVDFELAFDESQPCRPALGAPGFHAPSDRVGTAIDRYALWALRLWLFLPLNPLLALAPEKLATYVDFVTQRFPLPDGYGDALSRELSTPDATPAPTEFDAAEPDWDVARKSLVEAILATATPRRDDRLFPGDIEQFEFGGATYGSGAAGVLHALALSGAGRYPEHERWLIDTVWRNPPRRPGFYDGAHGIAFVLEEFGHHDRADDLLREFAPLTESAGHDLYSGLAGIGLTCLRFARTRDDQSSLDRAIDIGRRLRGALAEWAGPGSRAEAGLMHGWSGPALLFLHLHRWTGDPAWLDDADRALARDLDACVPTADGSLQVRDGSRTLPYLRTGSTGIAVVALELAAHRPSARAVLALPELIGAALGAFVIQPGLFLGRAGMIATLTLAQRHAPDERVAAALATHLRHLSWHSVTCRGGVAFPGNRLLRLSMDVSTGTAGVLMALSSALDPDLPPLPFLGERPQTST